MSVEGPTADGQLLTYHPPQVGDLLLLPDPRTGHPGNYQVVRRGWLYSAYGSANWPIGELAPKTPPLLDIIVEAAEGLFRGEAEVDATQDIPA
jgi:hypothetical protein